MLNSFIRGIFNIEEPPNKVLEVRSDNYISRPIQQRADSMLLYGPTASSDRNNPRDKYYEIILHKPFTVSMHHMYSLLRTEDLRTCEELFTVYNEKIPHYIKVTKDCSVASLQRICDTLTENKSWSLAHMVAHFGQYELFNDPDIQRQINEVDSVTGITPLMLSIKNVNVRMVQSLVSLNCSLDTLDHQGNTVLHFAAASNKDIVNILVGKTSNLLNKYNKQGYTPLHMACIANAPECVRALIVAGADVNLPATPGTTYTTHAMPGIVGDVLQESQSKLFQQDMKRGGTPLHWAISREVLEALADKNCDIHAKNFDGRTALHMMVLRGRLECAIALLSRGAEHSIGDNEGNTPLHLAVKQKNITLVQALIVFGADLEAKNKAGYTARHVVPTEMTNSNFDKILYVLHAVGAQRCPSDASGCGAGCAARGEYNGVPPPAVAGAAPRAHVQDMLAAAAMERAAEHAAQRPAHDKCGRLLCLDGGGIKGLVLVQILLNLEAVVGKPIIECFDWVAGTSTGGILALALACGKSLRDCQKLYFGMKEHAFVGSRPYPTEPLETILKDCLGTERVMADIDHPKLMILAVLADRKPLDLHMFRNYQSAQEILTEYNGTYSPMMEGGDQSWVLSPPLPPAEQLVWQAARATGAAPSYFRSSGRYLDGGLIGNNPTLDALTELTELSYALEATGQHDKAKVARPKVIVSCGTGLVPLTELKDIDIFKPEGLFETAALAFKLPKMGSLLVDQATQSDGRVVERARAWAAALGAPYYRFTPQLSDDVALNERADERLVPALWEAHAYMRAHRDRLAELAAVLRDA
ncbi:85/88 kDa calcium-independent phospholipase A2 [Vanessa atalanta]|uniref:85/88 kDa calcium-independent phospholipase A2 n=1 Tax=Vanessa atalanta TaxID=42275 RepID=UPI001FCCF73C|nr:85/88 kDa calcium-independent phospholipase A2 [Vanessa atalanta]